MDFIENYGRLLNDKKICLLNCTEDDEKAIAELFSEQGGAVTAVNAKKDIDAAKNADILVCGITDFGGGIFHKTDSEKMTEYIFENFAFVSEAIRAALPHMIESGGGAVVNIVSEYVDCCVPNVAAEAALSGMITAFSNALAMDYAKFNIRFNRIQKRCVSGKNLQPVERDCTASDIANAALFLASCMSDFTSGESLPVNGGGFCIGHNESWDGWLKRI